jgi:mono/diheme cytochrome c family protein
MQVKGRMLGAAFLVMGIAAAGLSLGAGSTKSETKAEPAASKSVVERGRYLAITMGCNDCHTPGALFGGPDFSRELSGSDVGWRGPWGTSFARNLTPDPETGLGAWTADEIANALRSGVRKDGTVLLPPMPWPNTAQMSEPDLRALVAYLRSLPPVKHKVTRAVPPGGEYAGPAIVLPAPGQWDAPVTASVPAEAAGTSK